MFSWFDARESKAFGVSLAEFFIEGLPQSEGKSKKADLLAKRKQVLGKALLKVHAFRQGRKLNVYQRAQLGNAFKWRPRGANYEDDFIDELTVVVMTELTA